MTDTSCKYPTEKSVFRKKGNVGTRNKNNTLVLTDIAANNSAQINISVIVIAKDFQATSIRLQKNNFDYVSTSRITVCMYLALSTEDIFIYYIKK